MQSKTLLAIIILFICVFEISNCFSQNILSATEKSEGWALLFNGKNSEGWHLYNKGKVKSAWVVRNGELLCDPNIMNAERDDLVSDKQFENFDLKFEWKISKQGNSGVFIDVIEKEENPKAWTTGPEYQLLEKSHHDYDMSPKKRSGCLYGFAEQKNTVAEKPAGQWNQSEIIQVNGKVEFFLNGVLTAEQDFTTDQWKEMVANSNFKTFTDYGKATKGNISLQDWSKGISFRNIKIKEL